MRIIGLCGGSGSGKSTVASMLQARGIPSLNADAIYHELVSADGPCLAELVDAFGEQIVRDGALDRRSLARIVFADGAEPLRARLNEITHRHVLVEARARIRALAASGARAVVFDAPLLFESGFDRECDLTVCVVACESVRVARLMERDGLSAEAATARIRAQISDEELMRKSDVCIHNEGTREELHRQLDRLLERIFP